MIKCNIQSGQELDYISHYVEIELKDYRVL